MARTPHVHFSLKNMSTSTFCRAS